MRTPREWLQYLFVVALVIGFMVFANWLSPDRPETYGTGGAPAVCF